MLAEQSITADDDAQLGVGLADFAKHAFAGIDFTILFDHAVGVLDGLRRQGDHLLLSGADDGGLKDLVMVSDTLGVLGAEALGTLDFFGREVFGAIQGDKIMVAQYLEGFQLLAALHLSKKIRKNNFDEFGITGVDDVPQLGIARDFGNAEEGGEIVFVLDILKPFLELKEGWVLIEHHGKGAHQAIVDVMFSVPGTRVGALREALGEDFTQAVEADVFFDMHVVSPGSGCFLSRCLPQVG